MIQDSGVQAVSDTLTTMLTTKGVSWLPGTILLPWLLAAAVFLVALFVILDKKAHPQKPLATIIRQWPWQDTFLGGGVLSSIAVVMYYMVYLIFCKPETMALFKDAMEPLFDFLNFWLIGAGLTSVGRRAVTKPEVVAADADAQVRLKEAGIEMPGSTPPGGGGV